MVQILLDTFRARLAHITLATKDNDLFYLFLFAELCFQYKMADGWSSLSSDLLYCDDMDSLGTGGGTNGPVSMS